PHLPRHPPPGPGTGRQDHHRLRVRVDLRPCRGRHHHRRGPWLHRREGLPRDPRGNHHRPVRRRCHPRLRAARQPRRRPRIADPIPARRRHHRIPLGLPSRKHPRRTFPPPRPLPALHGRDLPGRITTPRRQTAPLRRGHAAHRRHHSHHRRGGRTHHRP